MFKIEEFGFLPLNRDSEVGRKKLMKLENGFELIYESEPSGRKSHSHVEYFHGINGVMLVTVIVASDDMRQEFTGQKFTASCIYAITVSGGSLTRISKSGFKLAAWFINLYEDT